MWVPGHEALLEELVPELGLDILASFYTLQKLKPNGLPYPFMLDSGAFSAHNSGKNIDIDAYADYIKRNQDRITHYFNLDVIGNPGASQANQKYLERLGLKPIPVFHYGSDDEWLEQLVDEGYDYIGLGGLAKMNSQKKIIAFITHCNKIINGRAKVHLLGVAAPQVLEWCDYYSCDSTSYLNPAIYRLLPWIENNNAVKWISSEKGKIGPENIDDLIRYSIIQYHILFNSIQDRKEARNEATIRRKKD